MSAPEPIIEIVKDQLAAAEPSEEEVLASFASQIDDIVDHFWRETHQLAVEHAVLAHRQSAQVQQQQALFAVHRNAENNAHELLARQQWTTASIECALEDTISSLQQQLLQVADAQSVQLNESHETLRTQIAQLISNAQSEAVATHEALADQASQTMRLEHRVEAMLRSLQEELMGRDDGGGRSSSSEIASDVRDAWRAMETSLKEQIANTKASLLEECAQEIDRRLNAERITKQRTKLLISRSAEEVEKRIENNIKLALQAARDGDLEREQQLMRAIKNFTYESDSGLEARLRAEIREGQEKLKAEVLLQTAALSTIKSRIDQVSRDLSKRIESLEREHRRQPMSSETATFCTDLLRRIEALEQAQRQQRVETLAREHHHGVGAIGCGQQHVSTSIEMEGQVVGQRVMQLEGRINEMEQRLQEELKKLLLPKKRAATRGKKIDGIVRSAQRAVKGRAEVAARYYDIRWRMCADEERMSEDS